MAFNAAAFQASIDGMDCITTTALTLQALQPVRPAGTMSNRAQSGARCLGVARALCSPGASR